MAYQEITSVKQFNEILAANEHVIVDFYANWCGPCSKLAESFTGLKAKHPKITIVKINIDEEDLEEIVEANSVTSLPNIFYFKNGVKADCKLLAYIELSFTNHLSF